MNTKKRVSIKKLLVGMLPVLLMIGCTYASNEQISDYKVKAGGCLRKIAEKSEIYGYGKYDRRKDIYKANRDKIQNPDLIRPGWILIIPRP